MSGTSGLRPVLRREHHRDPAAVSVAYEDDDLGRMQEAWKEFGFDIPLEVVSSPYRELVAPIEYYLDELDERWSTDTITVVIPELVVSVGSLANVLHGQVPSP